MHLAAGRFKRHDRNRFRIHAYPVNRPDAEAARILQDGCDRVTGLDSLDDRAAAAQIRADGVDILVDLSGPNRLMRPGILAWRPAPLQMLSLGFAARQSVVEGKIVSVSVALGGRRSIQKKTAQHQRKGD